MMLFLAGACGKTDEPQPKPEKPNPEEFVIPQAPENVVSSNTFAVEYFSAMPASSKTASHILGASGKRPMVYVFDNVKYTPGKTDRDSRGCHGGEEFSILPSERSHFVFG